MSFSKVATMNAFANVKEAGSNPNKPDYSNAKVRIEIPIPAHEIHDGVWRTELSLGIWKKEQGLSLQFDKRLDDVGFTPAPQSQDTGDVDDIILYRKSATAAYDERSL